MHSYFLSDVVLVQHCITIVCLLTVGLYHAHCPKNNLNLGIKTGPVRLSRCNGKYMSDFLRKNYAQKSQTISFVRLGFYAEIHLIFVTVYCLIYTVCIQKVHTVTVSKLCRKGHCLFGYFVRRGHCCYIGMKGWGESVAWVGLCLKFHPKCSKFGTIVHLGSKT